MIGDVRINQNHDKQARQTLIRLLGRTLLLVTILSSMDGALKAQRGPVEAKVASVSGSAVSSNSAGVPSNLVRGAEVTPGDAIDTRSGGRVTIQLSDGSLVIVQPGSLVVFQDFRNASSLRELLKITVGRVRVRINHLGGPNPYRVNSPTASIAVRGTEFSVAVAARGDTEVVVYEGLIEVASLTRPSRHVLVEAGRGVIIRANEDIRFFVSGPSNEIGERSHTRGRAEAESNDGADAEASSDTGAGNSLRTAAGLYERYFESLVESGETPSPSRFTAFADSHLDSIENPSYATEFTSTEGRFFALPSFGGSREREGARELLGTGDARLVDHSFSPQASLFVPLSKYRAVVGGRVGFSRDGLQSVELDNNVTLRGSLFPTGPSGSRRVDGTTRNELFSISLVAARQFGDDGRTSLGLGVDYLTTSGSLLNNTTQTDAAGLRGVEIVNTHSFVNRTRFTFGLTRAFRSGPKLGVFYRYGVVSAEDRDLSRTLNSQNRLLNRTGASGQSSELGLLLRGYATRRLYYGIQGSYLRSDTDGRTRRARLVDSNALATSGRATIGAGLGYLLMPRTILTFDVSGGIARISDSRHERATGNLLEAGKEKASFFSLHGAVQADVWRRLFISGSTLSVTQRRINDLTLYPDRFGRLVSADGMPKPIGRSRDSFTDYFSNFGAGWRFSPTFLAEYIFSTDFGLTPSRHTLLLRYTFGHVER